MPDGIYKLFQICSEQILKLTISKIANMYDIYGQIEISDYYLVSQKNIKMSILIYPEGNIICFNKTNC